MEKIDLNRLAELLNNFNSGSDNTIINSKNESDIKNFDYQTIKCNDMTLIIPDEILKNLYSKMDIEALEKKLEELDC
ncbi:hypothetical protein PJV90_03400 [Aliarcobacter butzleri]|uniref:hypothetical protein n=1 Tax=Aliarcobacter butzleri TaxID=28197 RepID=UPI00263DE4FD|nr:hypothetical protein [Aliarcobacter butzleri]MDN5127375.1 hypothetical protein [Aliarcobacter butzleri]